MENVYLLSVLPLLLTEYGFRSSKATMRGLQEKFAWKRTLFRFFFWLTIASLTLLKHDSHLVMPVFSLFVIGEICCLFLRCSIRKDLRQGLKYGSIKTHMIPLIFPGVFIPTVYVVWSLYLNNHGISVDMGNALVTELLSPHFILHTKAILVSVVFISEWVWASLVTQILQFRANTVKREQIIDPGSARRELIGILERLVTLMLVGIGGHVGAGIVIAVKSTTRLPKIVDRQDADQFVIETLSSIGVATLGGFLIGAL